MIGEKMADQYHHMMNNQHPKLKFEIENPQTTPNSHSLSLPDLKVTISKENKSSFEFRKKKQPINIACTIPISCIQDIQSQLHLQWTQTYQNRCSRWSKNTTFTWWNRSSKWITRKVQKKTREKTSLETTQKILHPPTQNDPIWRFYTSLNA